MRARAASARTSPPLWPRRRRADQSKVLISMLGRGLGVDDAESGGPVPLGRRTADQRVLRARPGRGHPLPRPLSGCCSMGQVGVAEVGGRCPVGGASDIDRVYCPSRPKDREKDHTQDATPTLRPSRTTRQKFEKIRVRQTDRAAPSGAPPHPSRPPPGRASAAAHLPAQAPPTGQRPPTSATPTRPIEQQPERGRGSGCQRPGRASRTR